MLARGEGQREGLRVLRQQVASVCSNHALPAPSQLGSVPESGGCKAAGRAGCSGGSSNERDGGCCNGDAAVCACVVGCAAIAGEVFSSPVLQQHNSRSLRAFMGCRDDCLYCVQCCAQH